MATPRLPVHASERTPQGSEGLRSQRWGHNGWGVGSGRRGGWDHDGDWDHQWGLGGGLGWGGGFGLGVGWGGLWAPYWGVGYYDPWYDPWWGWDTFGGYYGGVYSFPPINYNVTYDTPAPPPPDSAEGNSYPSEPPADSSNSDRNSQPESALSEASPDTNQLQSSGNVADFALLVHLYLKNGGVYSAIDYWFAGNKLHYVLSTNRENSIKIDKLDLQRTVDENANRGVPFSLKPTPNDSSVGRMPK